jgi:hypothetical protein
MIYPRNRYGVRLLTINIMIFKHTFVILRLSVRLPT